MLTRPKHSLVRLLTSKASSVHADPVSEQQDKAPASHPASGAIGRGCAFASSRRVGAHALDKTTTRRKSVKRQIFAVQTLLVAKADGSTKGRILVKPLAQV
jgi:hypothetical protein